MICVGGPIAGRDMVDDSRTSFQVALKPAMKWIANNVENLPIQKAIYVKQDWYAGKALQVWVPEGQTAAETFEILLKAYANMHIEESLAKQLRIAMEHNAKYASLVKAAKAWYTMQSGINISDLYEACRKTFGSDFNPADHDDVE